MVDVIQIVLLSVIVLLSLVLITLGVQVFFILKDLRQTVKKTNKVLDNVEVITESISEPVSSISSFIGGTKALSIIAKIISMLRK